MQGYYRFPTIFKDQVVFTCEDDLWTVSLHGGIARRLTVSKGALYHPFFSPDGKLLAFTGEEEGRPEVYMMPAEGAPPKRLTFLDCESFVVGWHPTRYKIIFASNTAQPFSEIYQLYMVAVEGGIPESIPAGLATSISFGPNEAKVILRNKNDLAHWKRYRGGLTGDIWIDAKGKGKFRRLFKLNGNVTQPLWIGDRIFFISDHGGVGNIYSCNVQGKDIQAHTDYQDFYVRHINTDGERIVYQRATDLYFLDLKNFQTQKIEFEFLSSRPQRSRKFVSTRQHLADYDLHPKGQAITFTSRGKAFSMFNWEGGVFQHAQSDGIRYRLPRWLNSGGRLVMLSDASGEEALEIHHIDIQNKIDRLDSLDIGRALALEVSPKADLIAITNHRMELLLVDLTKKEILVLDRSTAGTMGRPSWSPDGKWLVYSKALSLHICAIYLCEIETGKIYPLTNPVLLDLSPSFDPAGKYIYFLSYRSFNPIADNLHFEISFPLGIRPYLITLKKDTINPFKQKSPDLADILSEARADSEEDNAEEKKEKESDSTCDTSDEKTKKEGDSNKSAESKEVKVEIDLEGIENRVVPFPVPDGRYSQIAGIDGNKVLFIVHPVEWLIESEAETGSSGVGNLKMYDFETKKVTSFKEDVSSFRVARDYKTIIYRSCGELRVVGVDDKDLDKSKTNTEYTKKSGWIDANRAKISVIPQEEWRQMFREAWRLQRDYFWTEDMSGVNWEQVYRQYLPLVDRIGTRSEMADLLLEMQGELGTSHAFEWGG
ncbi:PD40 domain-containing protein, partial [candidate division KSB1 bacterium]|nr:PD40 domain-containing protein [candidate division KSB1 bacterium]